MSDYGAPLVRGLLFGMALQLAVGPVCIFVFLAGAAQGFYEAMSGVLGAALVDALEIALAITGVGLIVRRGGAAGAKLRIFGALVLLLFGASYILDAVGFSILPDFALFSAASADGTFIKALLLTLSNPLTLVFWVGVFSVKVSREGYGGGLPLPFRPRLRTGDAPVSESRRPRGRSCQRDDHAVSAAPAERRGGAADVLFCL